MPTIWRDTLLFLSGIAGFFYMLIMPEARDLQFVALVAYMLGLPAFIRVDSKHRSKFANQNNFVNNF